MAKLLLAEDEVAYRDALPGFLATGEHEMRTAATGEAAIEIGLEFQPDLLIADWMLDGTTGLDVAVALRERNPGLKVIFITGFECREILAKAESRNITDARCLEKPFDIDDMVRTVEEQLKR